MSILHKKYRTYFENCICSPQQNAVPARGWRRFDEHRELKGDKDEYFVKVLPSLLPFRFYSGHLMDFKKQQESSTRVGCPWLCRSPCFSSVRHSILPGDFCSQLHHCPSAPPCQFCPCRNPSFPTAHLHLLPMDNLPLHLGFLIFKHSLLFEKNLVGFTQHWGSSQQSSSWRSKKLDKIPGQKELISLKRKGSKIRHILISAPLLQALINKTFLWKLDGPVEEQSKHGGLWCSEVPHCRRDFFMIIILMPKSL